VGIPVTITVRTATETPSGSYQLTVTATTGGLSHTATLILLVMPPSQGLALPIRVNAGGAGYTDSLGRAWAADWGYQQGTSFSTPPRLR
jgi:hypothetical protein